MLNFLPNNINTENGENNIWTGKLYEWDMRSDTVLYQNLSKSYMKSKGSFSYGTNSTLNSSKTKVNSFLSDLWDGIVGFFKAIGELLNIPGSYDEEVIIGWCGFMGGIFASDCGGLPSGGGGGGSGGSGGGDGGGYSGQFYIDGLYSSYLDGYNGYTGPGWNPYPTTDPCGGSQNVASTNLKTQQVPGGNGPCNPNIPQPTPPIPNSSVLAKAKVRAITVDILDNLETDYQVNFNLTNAQKDQIADLLYSKYTTEITQNPNQLDSYDSGSYEEDPPLMAKLKAYLRKMVGIDNPPETPEETQERANDMSRLAALGDYIKQLHETYKMIFGIVPGYNTLDDMMTHQYGSAAVNATFDIFGEGLLRFATTGILRVGSKYVIRASELAVKYPNIVNYFKNIRIQELRIIPGSVTGKLAVIGENMDRVKPSIATFQKIFKTTIAPFEPSSNAVADLVAKQAQYGTTILTDAQLKTTLMYQENAQWIQNLISEGYTIIDVGIDKARSTRSPFYQLETNIVYKR